METNTLRRIIAEEIRRSLGAEVERSPAVSEPLPVETRQRDRGLILCSGDQKLPSQFTEAFKDLQNGGVVLSALLSKDFNDKVGERCLCGRSGISDCSTSLSFEPFEDFSQRYQFLLLPNISIDLAIQTAWEISDTPQSRLLRECLRRKFPVFMMYTRQWSTRAKPWLGKPDPKWPSYVRHNVHQVWTLLLRWGVWLVPREKLAGTIRKLNDRSPDQLTLGRDKRNGPPENVRFYITGQDILALWRSGVDKVVFPSNATLTSEAADMARLRRIRIIYK